MILLDPLAGAQTVAPGICFVCERHMEPARRFVDTEHAFPYPDDNRALLSHLHGAKYICEHCALSAAGAVFGQDLREIANVQTGLEADLAEARGRISELEGMDAEVVEQIQRILMERTFTKPGPKAKPKEPAV